jgi:hypothetical protein
MSLHVKKGLGKKLEKGDVTRFWYTLKNLHPNLENNNSFDQCFAKL